MKQVIVIGGGPAGLKAAQTLASRGVSTTLVEASPSLGGLASSVDLGGTLVERYYHFVCKGDTELVDTLSELGLSERLQWRRTRMAHFVCGRLYPFVTPVDLLRFSPLSLIERIRAGKSLMHVRQFTEDTLASERAIDWLKSMFGSEVYRLIWEPLLRSKFGDYASEVSAAWIWARIVRLTRSRPSPWREVLGFIEGGTQVLINALEKDILAKGAVLLRNTTVERILVENGRVSGVRVAGRNLTADAVISTVPMPVLLRLCAELQGDFARRVERIPMLGVICACLRLRQQTSPFFWVNSNDSRVPFAGMIEYTNLSPLAALGGDRLLYVPQYLPNDDARFGQRDDEIIGPCLDALSALNPTFERSWVRSARVFRDRLAQPVCLTDYQATTPSINTPIPNLFVTDSCQLHPNDRSISASLGIGQLAGRFAHEEVLANAWNRNTRRVAA